MSSPPSSSNCRRSTTTPDDEEASDFSNLVVQEIGFVRESFEAVKMKASQKIDEANLAQNQFEELMLLPAERAEERDYKLRQLKIKVSKLRMQIPFKLIAPEELPNPNINRWRRLESNLYQDKEISHSIPDRDNNDNNPFPPVPDHDIASKIREVEVKYLACFFFFPKNAVIKRRILRSLNLYVLYEDRSDVKFGELVEKGLIKAVYRSDETLGELVEKGLIKAVYRSDETLGELVEKGLIQAVYKKSNLTVDGYRMHPSVHSYLRSEESGFYRTPEVNMYAGHCHDVKERFIYHTAQDFEHFTNNHTAYHRKYILHLGKWNDLTEQHIEIIDQELFFKHMMKLTDLRAVSLFGISMIEELPEFVTNLKHLEYLDLRACHNLEVIPPSIAKLKGTLKYLDISECYFLDHMPKALASLIKLRVLKGFIVGENKDGKSCFLKDLVSLHYLEKLNIYTSMNGFPDYGQLQTLLSFPWLRNLTISWGGCSAPNGQGKPSQEDEYKRLEELSRDSWVHLLFFSRLEKLDLQCVPETVTRLWLRPTNFVKLKMLYIRGGNFFDLGQSSEGSQWNVETLRLKHLRKLKMDWCELQRLFPKLMCLEMVDCPNLHQFPCNDNGIWMKNQPA